MAVADKDVVGQSSQTSSSASVTQSDGLDEKAYDEIMQSKDALAEQVGGVANALRSAVDLLQQQDQIVFAQLAGQLATGLERVSISLRDDDIHSIIDRTQDLARHRPALFFGGAVAAGFILSRFIAMTRSAPENESASDDG